MEYLTVIAGVFGIVILWYAAVILHKAMKLSRRLRELEQKYGITIISTYVVGNTVVAHIYDPNIDASYEIKVSGSPTAVREYHSAKENPFESFVNTLGE